MTDDLDGVPMFTNLSFSLNACKRRLLDSFSKQAIKSNRENKHKQDKFMYFCLKQFWKMQEKQLSKLSEENYKKKNELRLEAAKDLINLIKR